MSRTALVVDDSMLIRHTVCRFLEERGLNVESATNGVEALEILAGLQPDVIITDMLMPKMTGSELITELKGKPQTANIPVVVLAGKQSGTDHQQEQRAAFIIFKDIDIETQLERALQSVFSENAAKT